MTFQTENISDIAAKASIPVGVTGMTIYGIPLPEVVFLLTIVYTILLIINQAYVLYKWVRGRNEPKE